MLRGIFLSVLTLTLLTACDLKKRADHLKESTDEMKNTTTKVSKTSEGMKDRMDEMKTGVTHESLEKYISHLFGENGYPGSYKDNNEPRMILYANGAILAMEFQYWEGLERQTIADLDEEYARSARAFFVRTTQYIDRTFEVNPLIPDRQWKGIGALATSLTEVRPEFKAHAKAAGLGDLSFYAMIVRALELRDKDLSQDKFPKTLRAILEWKQEAIHFLQMRQIYLPMKVVTRMSDLQDRGNLSRLWVSYVGYDVDLSKFDKEQFKTWSEWLDEALETRSTLRRLDIEVKSSRICARIQQAMNLVNPPNSFLAGEFVGKFDEIRSVEYPYMWGSESSQDQSIMIPPRRLNL